MELIIIWIITIIASFILDIKNGFRIFKDVADQGYKIDINKMSEISKEINPDQTKISYFSILIPFINLLIVTDKIIKYNESKPMILDQLSAMDVIEEMTEYEKEEYQKKSTSFNAFLIPIKSEIDLKNSIVVKIKDKNGISEIFYKRDSKLNNIKILKVTGPLSNLSNEELQEKVEEYYEVLAKKLFSKFSNLESLIEDFKNNKSIEITLDDDKEENKLEIQEETKKIEEENIIEIPNENNVNEYEEGPRLTKKLK